MKRAKIKNILTTSAVLLVGIALTVTSFCVYHLIKPRNTAVLSVLCAVDFLYTFVSACLLLWYVLARHVIVKGLLLSLGYLAVFIAVPTLLTVFNGAFALLKARIVSFVLYAFFTGPCLIIILTIAALVLYLASRVYDATT